jgi:hypothetical protein
MIKNLQGKMVKRENAYEVWQNDRPFSIGGDIQEVGTWTWYVLKKYQAPETEAKNQYARWLCDVVTPMCPNGEMGDTYVADVKAWSKQIK